jgi:hypothetical protein
MIIIIITFDKARVGAPLELDRYLFHLTILIQLFYDFDCQQDPFIVIQALTMISNCHQKSKCHKKSLRWIESSLSLAFKHGLHCEDLADAGSI